MPITLAGYERAMINGIPVWKSSDNKYYAYEQDVGTNPIYIGSEETGFTVLWESFYETRLQDYREKLTARIRAVSKK